MEQGATISRIISRTGYLAPREKQPSSRLRNDKNHTVDGVAAEMLKQVKKN